MNRKSLTLSLCGWIFVWSLAATASLAAQAPRYRLIDLGTLGASSEARGINEAGQVVGTFETDELAPDGQRVRRPFLWLPQADGGLPAGMTDLGLVTAGESTWALDLNDSLQVVGTATIGRTRGGVPITRGYVWDGGSRTLIDPVAPGLFSTRAVGINQAGQVAGNEISGLDCRGFLWLPEPAYGLMAGLNPLPPTTGFLDTQVESINDRGEVAGRLHNGCDNPAEHPFFWLPEAANGWPAGSVALAPGADPLEYVGRAMAADNFGRVVGISADPPGSLPILPTEWTRAGSAPITQTVADFWEVEATNGRGQVIGRALEFTAPFFPGPTLWQDGEEYDLQDLVVGSPEYRLIQVHDLNETGQIVGAAALGDETRAILLEPSEAVLDIPTLGGSGLAILALGLVLFGLRRLRP